MSSAFAASADNPSAQPSPSLRVAMQLCEATVALLVILEEPSWKIVESVGLSSINEEFWTNFFAHVLSHDGLTELSDMTAFPGSAGLVRTLTGDPVRWVAAMPLVREKAVLGLLVVADAQERFGLPLKQRQALEAFSQIIPIPKLGAPSKRGGPAFWRDRSGRDVGLQVHLRRRMIEPRNFEVMGPEIEALTGHDAAEFLADAELMKRIVHPGDWATFRAYLESQPKQSQTFTQRWYGRDGKVTWVELEPHPIYDEAGQFIAFSATARDVTAQHETGARLQASEDRIRLFTEQVEDVIFRMRLVPELSWEYVSPSIKKVTGFAPEEFYANPLLMVKLIHPEDRPAITSYTDLKTLPPVSLTLRLMTRWGRTAWCDHRVRPVRRDDGTIIAVEGVLRDVTERKEVEDELQLAFSNFRTLIETLPDALFVQREGRISYVNGRFSQLLGRGPEELKEHSIEEFVPVEDRAAWHELFSADGGRERELPEGRIVRPDGTVVSAEIRTVHVMFDGRPSIACIVRDLTERRAMQARLILSDRMASVGTLAAGVAHEINNPLAFVVINLAFVSEQLERLAPQLPFELLQGVSMTEILDALGEAQEGSQRVRRIVRDLKTFSRADEEKREQVNIERIVETCINMARNEIRHRAQLEKDFVAVPAIEANEARLGQVFLNLLVNAAQSIEPGHVDRNVIKVSIRPHDNGGIRVAITDTGSGIPASVIPRIFDPFFTTKPVGVGTGLGLSICHNIVTSLGGRISVDTAIGRGTTFYVDLPFVQPSEHRSTGMLPAAVPQRRGRILVVDDEPAVGAALKRILRSHHHVDFVTSAREALSRMHADEAYDVILCDLMMPDITGMELFQQVKAWNSAVSDRIVFFTGGAFTPEARQFLEAVPNPRIEKPIDSNHLHNLLQILLTQRSVEAAS